MFITTTLLLNSWVYFVKRMDSLDLRKLVCNQNKRDYSSIHSCPKNHIYMKYFFFPNSGEVIIVTTSTLLSDRKLVSFASVSVPPTKRVKSFTCNLYFHNASRSIPTSSIDRSDFPSTYLLLAHKNHRCAKQDCLYQMISRIRAFVISKSTQHLH